MQNSTAIAHQRGPFLDEMFHPLGAERKLLL